MSNLELENVIEDSLNDAVQAEDGDTAETVETTSETSTESTEVTEPVAETSSEVTNPATTGTETETEALDEFAKRFGIQSQSVTGRENRIPYSRVKKIIERNEKDTTARVRKELETQFTPRIQEFETKVKDYEDRLTKVGQFEHILENDPQQFLSMLSQVPAYKEFFDYVNKLAGGASPDQPVVAAGALDSTMPQPDQALADGSKVYSMEGLQKLLAWQSQQVEERAVKQAEDRYSKRYEPIEREWQAREQMAKIVPVVEKQVTEARTWPLFKENEPEIIQALKADPNVSLERAYQNVVLPKIQADRTKMRTEVLAELKNKPMSTAAPVTAAKAGTQVSTGPRNLEDIIREEVAKKYGSN